MNCPDCQSTATTECPDQTVLGSRRFRCRDCQREFNERTGTLFNRLQYPTDMVCLVGIVPLTLISTKLSSRVGY